MALSIKNIGWDNGYYATKDSEGHSFRSEFLYGDDEQKGIRLYYNDQLYSVGKGIGEYAVDRIDSELLEICLLTSLGLIQAPAYNILAGLPIGHYKTQSTDLKDKILNMHGTEIIINGQRRLINIANAEIAPQGIVSLYAYNVQEDCIVLDIGGKTVMPIQVEYIDGEFNIIRHDTLYCGCLSIIEDIRAEINRIEGYSVDSYFAERVLQTKRYLNKKGIEKKAIFLPDIMRNKVKTIFKTLELKSYPYQALPIYCIGGGSGILYPLLKIESAACILLEDNIFANANGLKWLCDEMFPEVLA